MVSSVSRLLIAASGTGGHILPAISIAESLPAYWQVSWLGVPDRLEVDLVPEKFELFTIKVGGLQAKGWRKFVQAFKLLLSIRTVCHLIRKKNIQAVFTTGGYISAPAILSAKLCGIPVILHESNAFPGKVTRLLGWLCDYVALGIPASGNYLGRCKTTFTGTPVRELFFSQQPLPNWAPEGTSPLIVVMGGSQGALMLNSMVRPAIRLLLNDGCRVVHITGKNDLYYQKNQYRFTHPNLIEKSFSNEIAGLIQNADIVISRSGASAISELSICGTPAILVPYPQSTDEHQYLNASFVAKFGAAVVIHQHPAGEKTLTNILYNLLSNRIDGSFNSDDPIIKMGISMENLAVLDSKEKLVHLICSLVS